MKPSDASGEGRGGPGDCEVEVRSGLELQDSFKPDKPVVGWGTYKKEIPDAQWPKGFPSVRFFLFSRSHL